MKISRTSQAAKAEAFRALHRGPGILVLPNAWDVASACIFEQAGVLAIATTSAGIAFTLGYPDGEKISRDEMLAWVGRIAAKVKVPVSADIEAGYGGRAEDAARTAGAVIGAGAVGVNLEDSSDDPHILIDLSLQIEKITAMREEAKRLAVPLVINARTDVFLRGIGDPQHRYDLTLRRLATFREAGADCLFVPGLSALKTIERLVEDLRHPINILAGPGSPTIPELQNAGVARVSLGSSTMRATLGLARRIAEELRSSGTYRNLEGAPSHAEMNALLS